MYLVPEGRKIRGRPQKNWIEIFKNDFRVLDISRERAEELAIDRVE